MHVSRSSAAIGLATVLSAVLSAEARAEAPPLPRPPGVAAQASPPARPDLPNRPTAQDEALCGHADLRGESLPVIPGAGGCGVAAPVRLESAAGVAIEPPAVIACETAQALRDWLRSSAIPSFSAEGADLRALVVADAYSCRNRNRATTGKLSEHALGNAIDIGGFHLRAGDAVSVLDGWDSPDWGAALRTLRDGACGPFNTVLGPGSDALHADHFHFDVEERRAPWCE